VTVPAGRSFDPALLGRADALLVGGGLTPAYQQALAPVHAVLPALLRDGAMPYAGFSAGAAVASRHALVGGWTSGGVAVCPRDAAEDLDEIEVRPGLGLVPFTVDVHAAQWGTLSRLVEAVRRGDVPYGVAIDEDTRLTVHEGRAEVSGLGAAHLVRRAPAEADGAAAVSVGAYRAGRSFPLR
jgi:cyanophycinase